MEQSKIEEFKKQYPILTLVETEKGDLLFKKPTRADYDRWVDKHTYDKSNASANARELAQSCLVYPNRDGLLSVLEEYPAILLNEILDALIGMAKGDKRASVKKV